MKRRHLQESHAAHPNVTPLIDIVMCLIIFYMLVAKTHTRISSEGDEERESELEPAEGVLAAS